MDIIVYVVFIILLVMGLRYLNFFWRLEIAGKRYCRLESLDIKHKKMIVKDKIINCNILEKRRRTRINREIYEGLSLLRNIASTERGERASNEYIINCLARRKSILQEMYYKVLNLQRIGKEKEAEALFSKTCKSAMGEGFGSIIMKWEYTDKEDIMQIIISYQKSIEELNSTEERKKEEFISDLIYIPAMFNVLVIFINFIYIGFYAQQRELLNLIF